MAEADPSVRDLRAIVSLYEQIDSSLEKLRQAAETAGDEDDRGHIEHRQTINDQAYFVLAWGQLEAAIGEACRNAIRLGRTHPEWRHRRAWTLYNPEDRRLSGLRFAHRLSLVLDGDTDEWRRTMRHYEVRNQIAHGSLRPERIDVSGVIEDFHVIQSALAHD